VEVTEAVESGDELEHELLTAFAASDVVGVLQRLVGHEGDVRAADDHAYAASTQTIGHAVGGRRRGRRRGEPDEAGAVDVVPVDRRQLRRVDEHVVTGGGQRRADDRQAQTGIAPRGHQMDAG